MDKIFNTYNDLGDDFYYHHTVSEKNGTTYFRGPEVHRQYEVLLLIDGEITYIIEGETYTVTPGDMLFVQPGEIHTLNISGERRYERVVLLFDLCIMESLIKDARIEFSDEFSRRLRLIDKRTVTEYGLDRLMERIASCEEREPYKRMRIIAHLIEFIICLDKIGSSEERRADVTTDPLISRVIEYVDTHICEQIKLDRIAAELFVSKSTLCHRFAEYMNMPLGRYIATKKMHRADELMHSGHSASEVCRELGYDNYTTFYYNYKQIMGTGPSAR